MRYKPGHKEKTRKKILAEAGRLFRRHGYEGVGIERLMSEAELTRGGFYGHFRSKADLFAEVLAGEHDFIERLRARDGRTPDALVAQALEVVSGYLHPDNRERIGRGCYLASLSVDVARAGRRAKRAYEERLRELVAELARGLDEAEPDGPRALASAALCVGGVVLARGVADDELAAKLLEACERQVGELLGSPSAS